MISRLGANSTSACRQIPHGGVGSDAAEVITTRVKSAVPQPPPPCPAPHARRTGARRVRAFSTLQPAKTRPSSACKRRANREVRIRTPRIGARRDPPASAASRLRSARSSHAATVGRHLHQLVMPTATAEERTCPDPRQREPEPLGHRRAEIGERVACAQRTAAHARPDRQQRHTLARMVGGRRGRIVAVIGGDEQQIVLPKGRQQRRRAPDRTPRAPPETRGHRCDARITDRNLPNWRSRTHEPVRKATPEWPRAPLRCPPCAAR